LLHWVTARFWKLSEQMPRVTQGQAVDLNDLLFGGGVHETHFLRGLTAALLVTLAAYTFLSRYGMLTNEHGFLVGMDYLDEKIRLPLNWLLIGVMVISAGAAVMGKWRVLLSI